MEDFFCIDKVLLSMGDVTYSWENTRFILPLGSNILKYYQNPKLVVYQNGKEISVPLTYEYAYNDPDLSTVLTGVVGEYVLDYKASNSSLGISSSTKVRFFIVDDIAPSFIQEPVDLVVPIYSPKPDFKKDIFYEDNYCLKSECTLSIEDSLIDLKRVGIYPVYYTLSDIFGNSRYHSTFLHVVDLTSPILEIDGNLLVAVNSQAIDYLKGVRAWDNYDGDITSFVVYEPYQIDLTSLGTYQVPYLVKDSSSNQTSEVRTIKVVDLESPVIRLKTNHFITNTAFVLTEVWIRDNLLEVSDNYSFVRKEEVTYSTDFKQRLGNYKIIYSIQDGSGNYGESILTLEVRDSIKPIIEGNSSNILLHSVFDPYSYVKAYDNLDNEITDKIIIEHNQVDTEVEGLYEVVYSVYDSSGNFQTKTLYFNVMKRIDYQETITQGMETTPFIPFDPDLPSIETEKKDYVPTIVVSIVLLLVVGLIFILKLKHKTK